MMISVPLYRRLKTGWQKSSFTPEAPRDFLSVVAIKYMDVTDDTTKYC
jgi:hypothetical protein